MDFCLLQNYKEQYCSTQVFTHAPLFQSSKYIMMFLLKKDRKSRMPCRIATRIVPHCHTSTQLKSQPTNTLLVSRGRTQCCENTQLLPRYCNGSIITVVIIWYQFTSSKNLLKIQALAIFLSLLIYV